MRAARQTIAAAFRTVLLAPLLAAPLLAAGLIAALPVALAPTSAEARDGGWSLLGERTVDAAGDRDVVPVGRDKGRFTRLRIDVVQGEVHLDEVRVRYGNGSEESFGLRRIVGVGSPSPTIELSGDAPRFVREVELVYRSRGRTLGRVALLGDSFDGREARDGGRRDADDEERDQRSAEFETIDRAVSSARSDAVEFAPRRGEGRFRTLRIASRRGDVRLGVIDIEFENGERQSIELFERLREGEATRPLAVELTRERRRVTRVVASKRPSWRPGEQELELQAVLSRRGWRDEPQRDDDRRGPPPQAGRPEKGWVLLSAQAVGDKVERDIIPVGRRAGLFDKIALRIAEGDIILREVTIVTDDGERQTVPVNVTLEEGFRTAPLPIKGGARFVEKIEIVHMAHSKERRRTALVEIYGLNAAAWLDDAERRREVTGGWILLGTQRAEMFNADRDTFEIGERFGRFKAIRITAKRRSVRIHGLAVVYGNGDVETVPVSLGLREGQSTEPLEISSRGRHIDRIVLKYRSKLTFKGEGVVEVWGLR